jgi:hypothetical protein
MRGLQSPTPPPTPHRSMELVHAAETAANSFRDGTPEIDPVAVAELRVTVQLLERWKNHPEWPNFLRSLKAPQDFPHVVITLAAAGFLTDAGNAVELVQIAGERQPDLRLHLGATSAVAAEVKVPLALQRPSAIDMDTAKWIVRRAPGKAGSGKRGQLQPNADALLVVGGFGLSRTDLDALEEAAANVLQSYPDERRHVIAIVVISLGVLLTPDRPGIAESVRTLSAILAPRVVTNPAYPGVNRLSTEESPVTSGPLRGLPRR